MNRYCFFITYVPKQADEALLAARCASVMHGFTENHNYRGMIGSCFPKWSNESIGNIIGFVSDDKEALNELSEQNYFLLMQNAGNFKISPIVAVPKGLSEVRFVRNCTINKINSSSKKRRIARVLRRAKARGEVHVPINNEQREFAPFHSIFMESKSTHREFVIHIQQEEVDDVTLGDFDSYGLASNEKKKGSVPLFPPEFLDTYT